MTPPLAAVLRGKPRCFQPLNFNLDDDMDYNDITFLDFATRKVIHEAAHHGEHGPYYMVVFRRPDPEGRDKPGLKFVAWNVFTGEQAFKATREAYEAHKQLEGYGFAVATHRIDECRCPLCEAVREADLEAAHEPEQTSEELAEAAIPVEPSDMPATLVREDVLYDAAHVITQDRNDQYGSPEDSFGSIAEYWTTYLGEEITSHDVAMMMALLKVARIGANPGKWDSYVDLAGYAGCAAEVAGAC